MPDTQGRLKGISLKKKKELQGNKILIHKNDGDLLGSGMISFPSSPKNVPVLHCWLKSEFLPKVLSTESQLCPILIWHSAHRSSRSLFSYMYLCVFGPINFITNFFFFFLNLFIYFWLHWVFIAARRLSLVAESGSYSLLWCAGFSLQWLLLLWSTGSRCVGFSICGTRAQ